MANRPNIELRYDLRMQAGGEDAEIMVYGTITDWKWDDTDISATDFDKLLKQAKADGAKRLTLRINSPGGQVFQAVAMRTMLMNSGLEISVMIEGMCASAATLLACVPGGHVRMAGGSMFMVHNPMSIAYGNADEIDKTVEMLRKMEGDFHAIYAARTGQDEDTIAAWMNEETWFTAQEALDAGFVDEIMDAEPAAACISPDMYSAMRAMYSHMPDSVQAREPDEAGETVSTTEPTQPGQVTEINEEQEENQMDIKDITMDQLQAENPALVEQLIGAERERMNAIDRLAPAGYEALAAQAKADGKTPEQFAVMLVEAQKAKGEAYMQARRAETAVTEEVAGAAAEDEAHTDDADADAKEIAAYAKASRAVNATMY